MIDEPNVDLLQAAVARCVRVATRILPADVAEDVGQEAWIGLLQASDRGEAHSAEERLALLIGIFHNLCADAVRKYERRRRHLAFESEIGESPLDPVDRSSARIDLEELIERVVRPILSGLDRADVDLWIEAKLMGVGWKVAGEASGMGKAAIARARKRISRFLGSGDVAKRFIRELGVEGFEPRTPNPEPRTPNPEPDSGHRIGGSHAWFLRLASETGPSSSVDCGVPRISYSWHPVLHADDPLDWDHLGGVLRRRRSLRCWKVLPSCGRFLGR